MNIERLRMYCIQKPGVTESFPFGGDTLVFKVDNKIFLLASLSEAQSFNVKSDPEKAVLWREQYPEITPGYHMNKKHWNTVNYNQNLKDSFLEELIDHSYQLVFSSLPKATQSKINVSNS